MNKQSIAVIFGGASTEYGVSLHSASAVIKAIDPAKYDVVMLGITPSGEWFRFAGDVSCVEADTWRESPCCTRAFISPDREVHGIVEFDGATGTFTSIDAAFPVLHGKNGEDGTLQGLLELAGIPIVGCKTIASALCMDKHKAHRLAQMAGVRVPRAFVLKGTVDLSSAREQADRLGYPLFVKPVRSGSSFGITKVLRDEMLPEAIELALQHDDSVLIEENIVGFEVGCAVIGSGEELFIGSVDEVELAGGFFDFSEKYTLETSAIHVPARIPPHKAVEVKDKARRIYDALGCSGFARVDMFLARTGEILFNEVNTIPGFTEHSRFPNMMRDAGFSFEAIVNKLIESAVAG